MMLSLRGALRTGGGISLRQNVSLFHSTGSNSSTSSEPSIEIPQRVERSPTDILEALASTVSRDYTAPDYKFHDDPWLAPYKTSSKRDYALAKEAGRKSARYILNKHPDLFHHNRIYAEPPITAFQPRAAYNRDNVTLELLDNLVSSYQVTDAINVYGILKEKKKELPVDLKQRLLEVVAFHNEEEAEEEGYEARGALRADSLQWKAGGLADQLYSDGGAASPQARLALLLGYAKFGNKKGALQMWEECKANKDPLPLEAYHAYINSVNMRGVEKNIVIVKEILSEIQSAGLKPNTETLVSVLKLLSSTSQGPEHQQSCQYALDCVAEFKEAGVTISLGVYKMLLDIFVDLKSQQKNMILVDIMLALEGQDMWPASSLEDFYFFQRAQQVAMYLNRPKLAWQINELLLTGNNIALLAHMSSEAAYYNQFLQNILQNDSFEQSMELYYKVTPHLWSPTGQYYRNLLSALHSHGAVQHLGKVFDDMVLSNYGGSNKETCNELNYQVTQILERNEPSGSEFTGLSEVWTNIAKRIFDHLESNKDNRNFGLRFNLSAVKMCSLCITVQLREAGWEEAARTFRFCLEQTTVMPGQLDDPVLKALMEQSVSLKDQELALEIATYAQTMGSQGAIALGLAVSDGFELGPSQKEYLNKITMAAGPGKVLSTLPEHLKAMGQRYPHPVLSTGAGRRVMNADVWNHGLKKNMPHHYKEYYMQWQQGPKLHIHSKPNLANFEKDEWGEIHPVQNPRIYVVYPEIFHQGLWGGEGVVKGMLKRTDGNHRNFTPPAAKYWWPSLFEGVVHSEILGKHIDMVVTKRGVRLVDEAAGFDSYLLSTPVNEVYATGLLRLKRELLLALAQPGLLPDSVQRKYEKFRVSFEEADWHGLTMQEARLKQSRINAKIEEAKKIPDKVVFRKQLFEELREGRFEEDAEDFGEQEKNTGLLGGIKNIFGR